MTDPISFDPYTGWVDVTDPNNLPPDARTIGAADLLRYETLGQDIAAWTEQWADTDPGASISVDGNATTFRPRRWPAAQWTTVNPILASGEMGLEEDTAKVKFGDGISTWTALPYSNQAALDALEDGKADVGHTHLSTEISDSTPAGRAILTAPDTAGLRAAIGAAAAVGNEDIEITSGLSGLILRSPNGTRFRLGVDDDGALMTTDL
jgi:hypothetical protein